MKCPILKYDEEKTHTRVYDTQGKQWFQPGNHSACTNYIKLLFFDDEKNLLLFQVYRTPELSHWHVKSKSNTRKRKSVKRKRITSISAFYKKSTRISCGFLLKRHSQYVSVKKPLQWSEVVSKKNLPAICKFFFQGFLPPRMGKDGQKNNQPFTKQNNVREFTTHSIDILKNTHLIYNLKKYFTVQMHIERYSNWSSLILRKNQSDCVKQHAIYWVTRLTIDKANDITYIYCTTATRYTTKRHLSKRRNNYYIYAYIYKRV